MPKEYIEREAADELVGKIKENICEPGKINVYCHRLLGLPAADVVSVVRCRDCEQYVAGEIGYGKCNFFKTAIFSEFYCRYGGKKGRAE